MRTRDKEQYLKKIRERAAELSRLTTHTTDPDLIDTAFQALEQAVKNYQEAVLEW